LPPGFRQPARQIAALKPTYAAAHSTGISKTSFTARPGTNIRHPPAPFTSISEMPVQCGKKENIVRVFELATFITRHNE